MISATRSGGTGAFPTDGSGREAGRRCRHARTAPCQRHTQVLDLPVSAIIAVVPAPSPLSQKDDPPRQTCFCGLLGFAAIARNLLPTKLVSLGIFVPKPVDWPAAIGTEIRAPRNGAFLAAVSARVPQGDRKMNMRLTASTPDCLDSLNESSLGAWHMRYQKSVAFHEAGHAVAFIAADIRSPAQRRSLLYVEAS